MAEYYFEYFVSKILPLLVVLPALFSLFHVCKSKPLRSINYLIISYEFFYILGLSIVDSRLFGSYFDRRSIRFTIIFELTNVIFCVFELLTFSALFFSLFKNKWADLPVKILSSVNTIPFIYFLFIIFFKSSQAPDIYQASILFVICGMATLFIFCILFYYTTMQDSHTIFPKNKAILWVINSLFFYLILTIPFLFLEEEVRKVDKFLFRSMYCLHYISIGTLFFFIGIAFKTKKALTE